MTGQDQHHYSDGKKEVAQTTCPSSTSTLATSQSVHLPSGPAGQEISASIDNTSYSRPRLQSSLCEALPDITNDDFSYESEAAFVEMWSLPPSSKRSGWLLPRLLAMVGDCDRPKFCAARSDKGENPAEGQAETEETGSRLARRPLVWPHPQAEKTVTQYLKESQKRPERQGKEQREAEIGERLLLRAPSSLPSSRTTAADRLCCPILIDAMDNFRCSQDRAGSSARPDGCRVAGSDQNIVSGSIYNAGANQKHGAEARSGITPCGDFQDGPSIQVDGGNGGENSEPAAVQETAPCYMDQTPGRYNGSLAGPGQEVHGPAGRIHSVDHCDQGRDGVPANFLRSTDQACGREPAKGAQTGHGCRRDCSRSRREDSPQETGDYAKDLCGSDRWRCYGDRKQRFGDRSWTKNQERKSQRWCQGWKRIARYGCMIYGSSNLCPALQNGCCVPILPPRIVRFDLGDEETRDGPSLSPVATPTTTSISKPSAVLHSQQQCADCVYPFQAVTTALNLSAELFFQQTAECLDETRIACARVGAPLSEILAVLSSLARPCEGTPLSDELAVLGPTGDMKPPLLQSRLLPEHTTPELSGEQKQVPTLPRQVLLPGWARNVWEIFQQHALIVQRGEGPTMWIRTWYLHHNNDRLCEYPREIRLDEFVERWEEVLTTTWRDKIQVEEPIRFQIAQPPPRRVAGYEHLKVDVIVDQPLHHPRRSVLTSVVFPGERLDRMWIVAVSIPRDISRLDFMRQVGVRHEHWASQSRIFLGERELFDGLLRLPDGSGIVVQIQTTLPTISRNLMQRSRSTSSSSSTELTEDAEQDDFDNLSDDRDESAPRRGNHIPPQAQSMILYGLSRRTQHAYIDQQTYEIMLSEVADAINVHVNEILTVHEVEAQPTGIPATTHVAIVQKVNDIPPTNTNQLVLIDILKHENNADTKGERAVYLVPQFLTRSQLLDRLQLNAYCQNHEVGCLVFHNGVNWKSQDSSQHRLEHGHYLEVHLAPSDIEILTTQELLEYRQHNRLPGHESCAEEEDDRVSLITLLGIDKWSMPYDNTHPIWHLPDWPLTDLQPEEDEEWFGPAHPPILDMPLPIQDLYDFWQGVAIAEHPEEGAVAYFAVWFVHPERSAPCRASRRVRLNADYSQWDHVIRHLWDDLLEREGGRFSDWLFVRPQPPGDAQQQIAGHIILYQAVPPRMLPVLLTIVAPGNSGHLQQFASYVPHRINMDDLLNEALIAHWCRSSDDRHCSGWNGDRQVPDQLRINIEICTSLEIHVYPQRSPSHQENRFIEYDFSSVERTWNNLEKVFLLPQFAIDLDFPWHPKSQPWLSLPWWTPTDFVYELHIYYDGSYQRLAGDDPADQSGIAVVAFANTEDGWKFAGLLSSTTPWATSSYKAEVWAHVLAIKMGYDMMQICSQVRGAWPSVRFAFDALTVGQQAEGHWQSKLCPREGRILRGMRQMLDAFCGEDTTSWHVPGHRGEPGNEIVDVASKQAAQGKTTHNADELATILFAAEADHTIEWLWTVVSPHAFEFSDQRMVQIPAAPTTRPTAAIFQDLPQMTMGQVSPPKIRVQLCLSTCNILSMGKNASGEVHEIGMQGPSRKEQLLRQFHEAGVHVWAFQETRVRRMGSLQDSRYHLFHAPATDRGQFGVLVGFSKLLPYSEGHFFKDKDITIIAHGPRYLVLRVMTGTLKFILVAGHAPHRGAPDHVIGAYWHELSQMIPKKYDTWMRLLLADANAHVGGEPCDQIGDFQGQVIEDKDMHFAEFIKSEGLWLPSTYENSQCGEGCTWTHSGGATHRLDYIGLPLAWQPLQVQAWVDKDIELALQKEDHRPAMVEITFDVKQQRQYHVTNSQKIHLLSGQQIASLAEWNDRIPWHMDVHTHAALLQQYTCQEAQPHRIVKEKAPLKQTMTEQTWNLVLTKREARLQLHESRDMQKKTYLSCCFQLWQQAVSPAQLVEYDKLIVEGDRQVAEAWGRFRSLSRTVLRATRQDDRNFYDDLLREPQDYLHHSKAKQLWKTVRRSLPKYRQRRMETHFAKLASLEDEWLPHLAELELGDPTTPETLISNLEERRSPKSCRTGPCSIHSLPSLMELEDAIRATQSGKSTGLDPMESDFYKCNAKLLARLYLPLVAKMFAWQCEPLDWKGGLMHMIPKQPHPQRADQFRGIALLKAIPKRIHAMLRRRVVQTIERQRPAGQIGGFPAQQGPFGSQALRCFNRAAAAQQISVGMLFVDLRQAFHRLVRESVLGQADGKAFESVLTTLAAQVATLGADENLVGLLQDVRSETWTTTDGTQLLHTKRGTRPGSPLADVVFHIVMIAVVKSLDEWLLSQPLQQAALHALGMTIQSVIWSDDLAIPLCTANAEDLIPLMRALMAEIYTVFRAHGFELNMAVGKTSAVVTFRGPKGADMRKRYQLTEENVVRCDMPDGCTVQLHLVPKYKHLGTIYASNGQIDHELQQRIGQAKSAFQQLAKPLLCNRQLPLDLRVRLYKALVQSKMTYGMGAWPPLTNRQLTTLRAAEQYMMRRLLRWKPDDPFLSYAELLKRTGLRDVRHHHAVTRLLYAQKFFCHAPHFMQENVRQEYALTSQSWLHGVFHDIHWMQAVLPSRIPASWGSDLTDVIDFWQQPGNAWRQLVAKADRLHSQQEQMMHDVHAAHTRIFRTLKDAGATFSPDVTPETMCETTFSCACGSSFATNRGLLAHQRRAHGTMSEEHKFLTGATCPVCLKFFWSTQRLQQHLAYMPRSGAPNSCFQRLQQSTFQPDYVCAKHPALGLHRMEALQLFGPGVELPDAFDMKMTRWEQELQVLREELHQIHHPDDPARQAEQLGNVLALATRKWCERNRGARTEDRARHAVDLGDMWLGLLSRLPEEFHDWSVVVFIKWGQTWLGDVIEWVVDGELEFVLEKAFEQLSADLPHFQTLERCHQLLRWRANARPPPAPLPHRPVKWGPLGHHHGQVIGEIRRFYDEQEQWQEEVRACRFEQIPLQDTMPLCRDPVVRSGCYYIVHLFSGRRRTGDVHHWLQHYAAQFDIPIAVLSMDTAVSSWSGNLHPDAPSWRCLLALYRQQRIVATVAGTPCETWSSARHMAPPPDFHGRWPRPLRSASELFGLPELSGKEMAQLTLGTLFFLQGLEILAMHMVFGGFFISEHPDLPSNPDYPSTWRTGVIRALLSHPSLSLYHLQQWRWGAEAVKPTGMLVFNLPSFLATMKACEQPEATKPVVGAIGLNDQGNFRTSVLKEYPSHFSQGIAYSIMRELKAQHRAGKYRQICPAELALEEQAWLTDALFTSSHIRADAPWMPDYQG